MTKLQLAAERLHHLSMRYSGSLIELLARQPVGIIPYGHPGLREARDLIDLILLTRAEINGLTKALVDAGVIKPESLREIFAEEYEWLAQQKAAFLNVGLSDDGIVIQGAERN